jgi:hypothetical protein
MECYKIVYNVSTNPNITEVTKMAEFKRKFESENIKKLKSEKLFTEKLLPDIGSGKVFPAVRGGYMSFYHKGGSLFKYDQNGFSTHIKYAFVPGESDDYVTEDYLLNLKPVSFINGYGQIKKNCANYAGDEAKGVSNLFKFSPMCYGAEHRYYLIDIEVAFESNDEDKATDRIDILLYDNEKRILLFCEAKHFSNHKIWARENSKPEVIKQLDSYRKQIQKRREEIIWQYKNCFSILRNCFDIPWLNDPDGVYDDCGFLIFGFDRPQRKKIYKLLISDGSLADRKYYDIGDTTNANIETLFKNLIK